MRCSPYHLRYLQRGNGKRTLEGSSHIDSRCLNSFYFEYYSALISCLKLWLLAHFQQWHTARSRRLGDDRNSAQWSARNRMRPSLHTCSTTRGGGGSQGSVWRDAGSGVTEKPQPPGGPGSSQAGVVLLNGQRQASGGGLEPTAVGGRNSVASFEKSCEPSALDAGMPSRECSLTQ